MVVGRWSFPIGKLNFQGVFAVQLREGIDKKQNFGGFLGVHSVRLAGRSTAFFLERVPPLSCCYAWGIALWATACRWIRWIRGACNSINMPPLRTDMEPENGPFQKDISSSNHWFSADMRVFRECGGLLPASWLEKIISTNRKHFTWTFWKGGWIFLKDCPEQTSGKVRFSISHRIQDPCMEHLPTFTIKINQT